MNGVVGIEIRGIHSRVRTVFYRVNNQMNNESNVLKENGTMNRITIEYSNSQQAIINEYK
jgi:hypothetical protein